MAGYMNNRTVTILLLEFTTVLDTVCNYILMYKVNNLLNGLKISWTSINSPMLSWQLSAVCQGLILESVFFNT